MENVKELSVRILSPLIVLFLQVVHLMKEIFLLDHFSVNLRQLSKSVLQLKRLQSNFDYAIDAVVKRFLYGRNNEKLMTPFIATITAATDCVS